MHLPCRGCLHPNSGCSYAFQNGKLQYGLKVIVRDNESRCDARHHSDYAIS